MHDFALHYFFLCNLTYIFTTQDPFNIKIEAWIDRSKFHRQKLEIENKCQHSIMIKSVTKTMKK